VSGTEAASGGPVRRIVLRGQSTASVTTGAAMDFSIATPTNGPDLSPDCRYGIAGFLVPRWSPEIRIWLRGEDLNLRPSGYETHYRPAPTHQPDHLPGP
jgi:hypothetical protein